MCPLLSVRFYSFYFFIRFSMNIFFCLTLMLSWWAQVDSNHRPRAYQARALTTWAMSPLSYSMYLVSLAFSFRLTFGYCWTNCSAPALPVVEMMGFEPMTPCLQGRCSPNWATPPFQGSTVTENWTTKIEALCFHRAPLTHNILPTYDTTHSWKCVRVSIERRWSSRTFRYGYLVTT